jgi:uncharacterized protein YkwD/uncharacterized membrane protein required for colicin V production
MDLAGAFAGLILAFRFSYSTGDALSSVIGASPWTTRLITGGLIFVGVGLVASVIAARLQRWVDAPGLRLSNRLAGAGLALLWGGILATILLSLGMLIPIKAIEDTIDGSAVAAALIETDSPTQKILSLVSGDRAVEILLNLREAAGGERVTVGDGGAFEIPPVSESDLSVNADAAQQAMDLVNHDRLEAGLAALTWSAQLAEVGLVQAREMYETGVLSHDAPRSGSLSKRALNANLAASVVGENFALANDERDAQIGLMDSPAHRDNLLFEGFDSIGIGAVEGPYGLMLVQVFSG